MEDHSAICPSIGNLQGRSLCDGGLITIHLFRNDIDELGRHNFRLKFYFVRFFWLEIDIGGPQFDAPELRANLGHYGGYGRLAIRSLVVDGCISLSAFNYFQTKTIYLDLGFLSMDQSRGDQRKSHEQYRYRFH